ncbi:DUF2662 domain-containing protein [bacterium]|nr:MAG: DUF2662 domain-containing protein [bacterium]
MMDLWTQARDLWNGVKTPTVGAARVDFDGLIAELIRVANEERRKIGDRVFVPCDYVLSISSQDYADMVDGNFTGLMEAALQKALEGFLSDKKYLKQGPITVKIKENEQLDEGFIKVAFSFTPPVSEATVMHQAEPADMTVLRPSQGMNGASLEVLSGDATQIGQTLNLTKLPAKLGRVTRSQTADIGLVDATNGVGREHALIRRSGSTFSIEDTSLNGTWVNGVKLVKGEPVELFDGSEISLVKGVVVLRFQSADRTSASPRFGERQA